MFTLAHDKIAKDVVHDAHTMFKFVRAVAVLGLKLNEIVIRFLFLLDFVSELALSPFFRLADRAAVAGDVILCPFEDIRTCIVIEPCADDQCQFILVHSRSYLLLVFGLPPAFDHPAGRKTRNNQKFSRDSTITQIKCFRKTSSSQIFSSVPARLPIRGLTAWPMTRFVLTQ